MNVPLIQSFRSGAFTLIELLVATAILSMLMVLLLTVTNNVSSTLTHSSARLDAFASGRTGFDIVSQNLSRATLNTYWDYYDVTGKRRTTVSIGGNGNYSTFVPAEVGSVGCERGVPGTANMAASARKAKVGSTKMLPSGPVVPPESRGCPTGWEARRW